jgi:hypothetical protein
MTITDAWKLKAMSLKLIQLNSVQYFVGLYTNNYTPTRSSTLANFTEPTFPWYARQQITIPGTQYINAGGFAEIDANLLIWTPLTILPAQLVYGYFVYCPSLTQLMMAELNPAGPQPFGGSLLPFIIQWGLQESQFNPVLP